MSFREHIGMVEIHPNALMAALNAYGEFAELSARLNPEGDDLKRLKIRSYVNLKLLIKIWGKPE